MYAYAHFLGESPEYVLNQVIDTVLAKDKEFVQWRSEHPDSYVPRPTTLRGAALRHAAPDRVIAAASNPAGGVLGDVVIRWKESGDAPYHSRCARSWP